MKTYMKLAEELTKNTKIVSRDPGDPVEVLTHPEPWKVVGCGNYAAVFLHPEFPDLVVKIYGRNPEGLLCTRPLVNTLPIPNAMAMVNAI